MNVAVSPSSSLSLSRAAMRRPLRVVFADSWKAHFCDKLMLPLSSRGLVFFPVAKTIRLKNLACAYVQNDILECHCVAGMR